MNKKIIFGFILGIVLSSSVIYAATLLANNISYDNTNSGITSTNVQGAIDELYNKASNGGSGVSEIINDFEIEIASKTPTSLNINLKNGITTTDSSNVNGYVIYLNNKVVSATHYLPYNLEGLTKATTYSGIYVEAVDQDGKVKRSNVLNDEVTLSAPSPTKLNPIQYLSSSNYQDAYNQDKAFDGDNGTWWHQRGSSGNYEWIGAKFSSVAHIDYVIASTRVGYNFTLRGSNDGTNWTDIETFTYDSNNRYNVTAANSVSYQYYSLLSTRNNIDNFQFTEISFYGYLDE